MKELLLFSLIVLLAFKYAPVVSAKINLDVGNRGLYSVKLCPECNDQSPYLHLDWIRTKGQYDIKDVLKRSGLNYQVLRVYDNPPQNPKQILEFLKQQPAISAIEIHNEPNFAPGTKISPQEFAKLLAKYFLAVKVQGKDYLGRDIKIISGGLFADDENSAQDYLKQTYQAGKRLSDDTLNWENIRKLTGSYPLDAVGYHLYFGEGGTSPETIKATYNNYLSQIEQVIKSEDPGKKIWVTEFGWRSKSYGVMDEEKQAEYLKAGAEVLTNRPSVDNSFWFSAFDIIYDGQLEYFGLFSEIPGGLYTAKKSFYAFRDVNGAGEGADCAAFTDATDCRLSPSCRYETLCKKCSEKSLPENTLCIDYYKDWARERGYNEADYCSYSSFFKPSECSKLPGCIGYPQNFKYPISGYYGSCVNTDRSSDEQTIQIVKRFHPEWFKYLDQAANSLCTSYSGGQADLSCVANIKVECTQVKATGISISANDCAFDNLPSEYLEPPSPPSSLNFISPPQTPVQTVIADQPQPSPLDETPAVAPSPLHIPTFAIAQANQQSGIDLRANGNSTADIQLAGIVYTDPDKNPFESCIPQGITIRVSKAPLHSSDSLEDDLVKEFADVSNCQGINLGMELAEGRYKITVIYTPSGKTPYSRSEAASYFSFEKSKPIPTATNITVPGGQIVNERAVTMSADWIKLAGGILANACTTPGGDHIPKLSLIVSAVLADGSTKDLEPVNSGNCVDTLIDLSSLGEIANINRLSLTANYTAESSSTYAGSGNFKLIYINDSSPVQITTPLEPVVALRTFGELPTSIIADSNLVISDPRFEIIYPSGQITTFSKPARLETCQAAPEARCEYQVNLNLSQEALVKFYDGNKELTSIQLQNPNQSTTSPPAEAKPARAPIAAYLQIPTGEAMLPISGGQISFPIEDGENTITLKIVFDNGDNEYRVFKVVYEPPAGQPNIPATDLQPATPLSCIDERRCNGCGTSLLYRKCDQNEDEVVPGTLQNDDSCKMFRPSTLLRNECTSCHTYQRIEQYCTGETFIAQEGIYDENQCNDECSEQSNQQSCAQEDLAYYCEGDEVAVRKYRTSTCETKFDTVPCKNEGKQCYNGECVINYE